MLLILMVYSHSPASFLLCMLVCFLLFFFFWFCEGDGLHHIDWMHLLCFSFFYFNLSSLSYRMTMVTLQSMKTEPPVSFLLLQKFLGCLDWYLGIMASWMIVKIHFRSCQILLTNSSTSYVVETKMGIFVLVYLASSL